MLLSSRKLDRKFNEANQNNDKISKKTVKKELNGPC